MLNNKENELSIHMTKKNIGLNIDNFITSFSYNIVVMREKIIMFITYIEFFHKLHTKYLRRFSNKIQLMYSHINNDIKFDDSIEINRNKRKELIDEFSVENIDGELLKDIKKSMGSESISSESENDFVIDLPDNLDASLNSTPKSIESETNSIYSLSSNSIINTIKNKIKPTSLLNLSSNTNDEKNKSFKEIIKKNVNKVSDMLQLCTSKEGDVYDPLSNEEIKEIFSEINKSCDDIIDTENIKMIINPMEKNESKDDIKDNNLVIKGLINPDDLIDNSFTQNIEEITEEIKDIIEEEIKQEVFVEENKQEIIIEEQKQEEVTEEETKTFIEEQKQKVIEEYKKIIQDEDLIYESNYTTENEATEKEKEKEQPKKKRAYNKKKK